MMNKIQNSTQVVAITNITYRPKYLVIKKLKLDTSKSFFEIHTLTKSCNTTEVC